MKKKLIIICSLLITLALAGCLIQNQASQTEQSEQNQISQKSSITPTSTSIPTPTSITILEPTNTPTPTEKIEITQSFTDDDLVTLLKSFEGFDEFNDDQIQLIIESKEFETQFNYGMDLGDVDNYLKKELSGKENINYLKMIIPELNLYADNTSSNDETPSILDTNTGGGSIVGEDSNKGGSDEDEVAGDDFWGIVAPVEELPEYTEDETPTVETSSDAQFTFTQLNQTMYASKDVNFRKGPSTDYDKLGNLYAGEKVLVIAQCNETGWYLIKTDRLAEFVYVTDAYLTTENPYAEQAPVENETPKPTEKPKTGSAILETYTITTAEGETITLENVSGDYVEAGGQSFFIPDGLGETFQSATAFSYYEMIAWSDKYPDTLKTYKNGEDGFMNGGTIELNDYSWSENIINVDFNIN